VLPKGVILYGPPGCGKTLFMKEIKSMYESNVWVIDGGSERPIEEIDEAFKKSIDMDYEIILIDELNLLLKDERMLVRKLQTCMDGLDTYDNVLIIATANNLSDISEPLLRPGRFDRSLHLSRPSGKDRREILINSLEKNKIAFSDIDLRFLSKLTVGSSCADIIALINDCVLRNKGKDITMEMIEQSYNKSFSDDGFIKGEISNKYTAMHEAGHALLVNKNKEYFLFYRASIERSDGRGGKCTFFGVDEKNNSMDKKVANIEIGVAGYLANRIIYKHRDAGAIRDLRDAVYDEFCLVNAYGYKGIEHVFRDYNVHERNETERTCYKNEVIARRELQKIVKRVSRYIKSNKKKLIALSSILEEKGVLDRFDLEKIMSA